MTIKWYVTFTDKTQNMKTTEQIIDALISTVQYGTPTDGAATLIDVGTNEFLSYVENEIIDDFISQGGSTCRFFEGNYGSGKTHLLHLLRDLGLRKKMAVVEVELSEALKLQDWDSIVRTILNNIQWGEYNRVSKTFPGVLKAITDSDNKSPEVLCTAGLPHAGYARAISAYLSEIHKSRSQKTELLRRFLLGEKITVKELKSEGILGVRNSLSPRNAETVFNTIISCLYFLGLPGVMILFDETDQNSRSWNDSNRKAARAANIMRRLIDACSFRQVKGMFVVFALLPNFIQACTKEYPALYDRLVMPRRNTKNIAWRSPVLRLDAITSIPDPEKFLQQIAEHFSEIGKQIGITKDFKSLMLESGQKVLLDHAGLDFRRPLVKLFSNIVLTQAKLHR